MTRYRFITLTFQDVARAGVDRESEVLLIHFHDIFHGTVRKTQLVGHNAQLANLYEGFVGWKEMRQKII